MIFHRGVGVIRKKDLFIAQKIDLLVKYLIAWPSKQVCSRFLASVLLSTFSAQCEATSLRWHIQLPGNRHCV